MKKSSTIPIFYPFASRNNPAHRILLERNQKKIHKTFFLKTISTFFDEKYGRKKLMNPVGPIKSFRHTMPPMYQ